MKKERKLAAYVIGSGERPIVFLHGFLASARYWRKNQKALAKDYRTIAFDLLGFGKSPKPRHLDYNYEDHLRYIDAAITQETSQRITLVGHSMGALLSLRYAVRHPERVEKVYLFNPPLFLDQQQARANLGMTNKFYQLILYSKWRRWFWRTTYLLPIFYVPGAQRKRGHLGVMRHTHISRERSLQNIIEDQQSFADLQKISVPTKLIVSRYDRYAYQQNLALHDLPPNVEIVFKESDHHFPIRHPEEVVEIITR